MNEEKKRKAEILLDAIGEIDDELLCEAIEYKRRRISTRVLATAATFLIMLALIAGSAVIKQFSDMSGNMGEQSPEPNGGAVDNSPADEGTVSVQDPLNDVFATLVSREGFDYVTDPDTLPYLDGNAYIVWRYSDDERYYISEPLKNAELETIKYALGNGLEVGESSPEVSVWVWVLLGDGRVISPYLSASSGNISSEIFEYEVEIVPDKHFADKILSILG